MWLDLTTGLHLVVHGTSGSPSYETIPPVRLDSSGGVLSTVDMVVQRRDGPRRLRELDDDDGDDDDDDEVGYESRDRSFSTAAPSVWNSLPASVQNCDTLTLFISRLKAHLFSSVCAS